MKELSICQSSQRPGRVSFPALSQIKPQAPLLVVPFRQFLQVSALQPYFPRNPKTPVSLPARPPRRARSLGTLARRSKREPKQRAGDRSSPSEIFEYVGDRTVGIVYGRNYDGI